MKSATPPKLLPHRLSSSSLGQTIESQGTPPKSEFAAHQDEAIHSVKTAKKSYRNNCVPSTKRGSHGNRREN
jgi:hypothetical protein